MYCNFADLLEDLDFPRQEDYLEKLYIDSVDEPQYAFTPKRRTYVDRGSAWERNRLHKKKVVRRFLSANPSYDFAKTSGTSTGRGVYVYGYIDEDGSYIDHKHEYCLNANEHIYISLRGDLRVYHGWIFPGRRGYALGAKDSEIARLTKKRIRSSIIHEDDRALKWSDCKRIFAPIVDTVW